MFLLAGIPIIILSCFGSPSVLLRDVFLCEGQTFLFLPPEFLGIVHDTSNILFRYVMVL